MRSSSAVVTTVAFSILASSPSFFAAADCSVEIGYDYPGGDLLKGRARGSSIDDCIAHCQARSDCTRVTYIWGKCWLKDNTADRQPRRQGISANCSSVDQSTASPTSAPIVTSTHVPKAKARPTVAPPRPATPLRVKSKTQLPTTDPESSAIPDVECILEVNTRFRGGTFTKFSGEVSDCVEQCLANEQCTHFTHTAGKCRLKSGAFVGSGRRGSTSAVCSVQRDTPDPVHPQTIAPRPAPKQTATSTTRSVASSQPQATLSLASKGTWKAMLPDAVNEAQGAEVNGRLYVFGGFANGGFRTMAKETYRYDPVTDVWNTMAQIPITEQGITHTANIVVPGTPMVYLAGGLAIETGGRWPHGAHATAVVLGYDTDADTWTALPDLPEARGGCAGAYLDGYMHVFGGAAFHGEFTQDHATHWRLDMNQPSAQWEERAPLSLARNHLGSAVVGNKIFAVGGQYLELEGCSNQAMVESYDSASDTWTQHAPLPLGIGHISPSVIVSDYGLLVVGGVKDLENGRCAPPGARVNFIHHYDVAADEWHAHPLNNKLGGASMVAGVIGSSIYAQHANKVWKLDFDWTNIQFGTDGDDSTPTGMIAGLSSTGFYAVVGAGCFLGLLVVVFVGSYMRRRSRRTPPDFASERWGPELDNQDSCEFEPISHHYELYFQQPPALACDVEHTVAPALVHNVGLESHPQVQDGELAGGPEHELLAQSDVELSRAAGAQIYAAGSFVLLEPQECCDTYV